MNKKQKNLYYGLAGLGVAAVTVTSIAVPLVVRNNKSTTTSAVTEAKAKLGDIELSAWDLPAGTDEAVKAAIINELVANGELTLSDSTINAGADSKLLLPLQLLQQQKYRL